MLFAGIHEARPWSTRNLEASGDWRDVGLTFLKAVFGGNASRPESRRHEAVVRAALKNFLPGPGTGSSSRTCSYREIMEAMGHSFRRVDCEAVLRLLDEDLGLITPIEPDVIDVGRGRLASGMVEQFYRLTHDYLVTPLRRWLAEERGGTAPHGLPPAGRAAPADAAPGGVPGTTTPTVLIEGHGDLASQIDINTATLRELQRLPGIGESTARRIIAARPFEMKEDLKRVEGIGGKRFDALRNLIMVP